MQLEDLSALLGEDVKSLIKFSVIAIVGILLKLIFVLERRASKWIEELDPDKTPLNTKNGKKRKTAAPRMKATRVAKKKKPSSRRLS